MIKRHLMIPDYSQIVSDRCRGNIALLGFAYDLNLMLSPAQTPMRSQRGEGRGITAYLRDCEGEGKWREM